MDLFHHCIGDVEDDGVIEGLDDVLDPVPLLGPHVAHQVSRNVACLGDGNILKYY
jgi:hypothetical protein